MTNRKHEVDGLDQALIGVLSEAGRRPLAEVADRLGVSTPTVRARLRALVERGFFRVG